MNRSAITKQIVRADGGWKHKHMAILLGHAGQNRPALANATRVAVQCLYTHTQLAAD